MTIIDAQNNFAPRKGANRDFLLLNLETKRRVCPLFRQRGCHGLDQAARCGAARIRKTMLARGTSFGSGRLSELTKTCERLASFRGFGILIDF